MKSIKIAFDDMLSNVPQSVKDEIDMSVAIADKLDRLIKSRDMSKKEFAEAFGCRPSEVSKWLSGQQNFTLRTLAKLSSFFGEPLIVVNK